MRIPSWAAAAALVALPAMADCPDEAEVAALAADILAGTPGTAPEVATLEAGLCAQDMLVAILSQEWGAPVGLKAGLTSPPAQANFGVTEPVRGVLFADMFLPDGATLPAAFAARPLYEADFIVVVGDAAINEATTHAEVMAALDTLHPFIELPDLVVEAPGTLTGPKITAINVGARMGILGEGIPADPALIDVLAGMQVTITDQNGEVLASAPGAAILGHPLNAVLWLRDSGLTLSPGDMLSLGSFGPLLPPRPGLTATITWAGLPGDPSLSVSFE
jgi:2-oxo-hept-3-ene-1,7-dioate hydratase